MKIKKLDPEAIVPEYKTTGAAGADLYSLDDVVLGSGARVLVRTGLAIQVSEGYEAQIRPRSGLAFSRGITVLNAPGTIDSDYRGEVKVLLVNMSHNQQRIKKGERIAQLCISKVFQVDFEVVKKLDSTERGAGGFGSTGRD